MRWVSLLVRTLAAFLLACIGAFLGAYVGLLVGVALDAALGQPFGPAPLRVVSEHGGWLELGLGALGLCVGAAALAVLPGFLAGSGARPLRALAGAAVGLCVFVLARDPGALLTGWLLATPLAAACAASFTRADD